MSTAAQRRQISKLRILAHGLVGPTWQDPSDAARAMMCLQGQDWQGVLVSLALRSGQRGAPNVRAVIDSFDAGALVRTWPQRGTLHVLAAEDLFWYLPLSAQALLRREKSPRTPPPVAPHILDTLREMTIAALLPGGELFSAHSTSAAKVPESPVLSEAQTGSESARPVGRVSRDALIAFWHEHGFLTDRQFARYFLYHLSIEGVLVQGPIPERSPRSTRVGQPDFVLAHEWIRNPTMLARDDAVAELVWRFLHSHGPASRRDLARWSNLPLRDVDAALEGHRAELTRVAIDGEEFWFPETLAECGAGSQASSVGRSVLVLPGFDELILGYASRWMTVPSEMDAALAPGKNGIFRGSIVAGGTLVGLWKRGRNGPVPEYFVEPSAALAKRVEAACARYPILSSDDLGPLQLGDVVERDRATSAAGLMTRVRSLNP